MLINDAQIPKRTGAEDATRSVAEQLGDSWLRDPATGHGTMTDPASIKMRREAGRPMAGDPEPSGAHQHSMFDTVPEVPFHNLSPRQFAASPHVWWHGKYGEDLPSDSYKEGAQAHVDTGGDLESYVDPWDDEEGDAENDKSGHYGIHFGTHQAAVDRLNKLGPGRAQSEGEDWDLSQEGGPKVGDEPRIPGRLFPVTLNHDQFNPQVKADLGADWRPAMGYENPAAHGTFYRNEVEDQGSVSAAVPERETSIRSMFRSGEFFKSWNDHVLGADPETVHPMLRWAAQQAPEHTGEDWIHPDDQQRLQAPIHAQQGRLFQPYGKPAYLDEDYKNTLGPSIKVGGS